MILYHRTYPEAAQNILENGFRDGEGNYGMTCKWRGVWLSNEPPDENDGAHGDILLEVNTSVTEAEIAENNWEIIEDSEQHSDRGYCIPAQIVNARSRVRIVEDRREFEPDWAKSDDIG